MNRTKSFRVALLASALAAASLAGCFGDDEDEVVAPAPTAEVPNSAGASIDAFASFIKGLVNDETSEPLGVNSFTAPADETSEPTAAV